jgi:methionyl-tRNA formyltransferase
VRIVFLGTPVDAVPALVALHEAGHEVALVVTQPDRRRGRGSVLEPSPVRAAAEQLGLEVRTPARAREALDDLRASGAALGVVVAFGQLLPPDVLATMPLGFVNVHFSLLPRWRGAAPVERAVLAGDRETGVCVMEVEEGLDTGPVYASARTPIGDDETAGELRTRLVTLGTELLLRSLPDIGVRAPEPQVGEPTYADKLTVEEFRLDPARPAAALARVVCAGNPRPGAWMMIDGQRVKVLRAHAEGGGGSPGVVMAPGELITREGFLVLDEVQVSGKRPMSGDAWMRGLHKRELVVDPIGEG